MRLNDDQEQLIADLQDQAAELLKLVAAAEERANAGILLLDSLDRIQRVITQTDTQMTQIKDAVGPAALSHDWHARHHSIRSGEQTLRRIRSQFGERPCSGLN